jgi:hypothetical protein
MEKQETSVYLYTDHLDKLKTVHRLEQSDTTAPLYETVDRLCDLYLEQARQNKRDGGP